MNSIKSLVKQVIPIIDKYETIEKLKGEKFNIFTILNMENKEVETHSAFLYELLNLKGSHQLENLFLKLFIKDVLKFNDPIDYKSIQVLREVYANKNGRIDLLIEDSTNFIVIEIKIDASDQEQQIKRYDNFTKNIKEIYGKNPKIYYLTKFGTEASLQSLGDDLTISYIPISFSENIVNFLKSCIKEVSLLPPIREVIKQYMLIVKKITDQKDEGFEKEFLKMFDSIQDIKAATEISNMLPKIWANKEVDFWESLFNEINSFMSANGFTYNLEESHIQISKILSQQMRDEVAIARVKTKNSIFGLYYEKELLNNYILGFHIYQQGDYDHTIGYSVNIYNHENKINLTDELKDLLTNVGFTRLYKNNKWVYSKHKVKFFTRVDDKDKTEIKDFSFELFEKKSFIEMVQNISLEIKQLTDGINQNKENIIKHLK